jgi:protein-L-isoaspartate(D-aspartate) O-methyltransferase
VTPASQDNYRHQGLRRKLVEQLKGKGIKSPAVLEAIGRVPRHLFIDGSAFLEMAYQDTAFPIPCGQTISQPYTVAFQTELLGPLTGMKVLEVGTGSGYQTAVLCELGARVFTIERQKPLYMQTRDRLQKLGYRASLSYGDGYKGLQREAQFDRILVTCGAPFVPEPLFDQLRSGGRLVIPVGQGDVQRMMLHIKEAGGAITTKDMGEFRFVPMLQDKVSGG